MLEVPSISPWPTNGSMFGLLALYDGDTFVVEEPTVLHATIQLCTRSLPCMLNLVGTGHASVTITGDGSIECLVSSQCVGISIDSLNFACQNTSLPNSILRVQGTYLTIRNTTFAGCSALSDGTAIQVYNGATVSIASSLFKDMHSNGSGGAISIVGGSAQIVHTVFVNCQSGNGGGAIWYEPNQCFQAPQSENANLVVEHSEFEACISHGGGGAILASVESSAVNETLFISINTTVFRYCRSDEDGGAIKLVGSLISAKLLNLLFDSCVALSKGGAISCEKGAHLGVVSSTLERNSALGIGGGALYILNSTVFLDEVVSFGNSAPAGGGGSLLWHGSDVPKTLDPIEFCGPENSAMYGNCLASDFQTLRILVLPQLESSNALFAGIPFSVSISKLDFYNQPITTDSSSVVQIFQKVSKNPSSSFSTSVLGNNVASLLQGTVVLSIFLKPAFSVISFKTGYTRLAIEMFINAAGFDNQANWPVSMSSNVIHVNFENGTSVCPPGYILRMDNESILQGTAVCTFCQPGTYSLNPLAPNAQSISRAPACLNCPSGGRCNEGGNIVTFALGIWIASPGMYTLISCPTGFMLTNTSASGVFSHDNQQCGPCQAGYFLSASDSDPVACDPCPPGYYCTGGTAPKAPCEPGRISTDGANNSAACQLAPFVLVAEQMLPMSLDAFTAAAAQNFRFALALAAGVGTDRVLLLAVLAFEERRVADARITVRSQIALDNGSMVDSVTAALQSPSSTLNAHLALYGLPGGSLQSLTITVEGQPLVKAATPIGVIAGSIIGTAVFVGLVLAACYQLLVLRKKQAERADLQATFELAKPGDRATGRHLPIELCSDYAAEKVLGNGPFR
jgi:hypothetical protein